MVILGFAIQKGFIHFAVLEGTSMEQCDIKDSNKIPFQSDSLSPELMNTFESNFSELLVKYKPDTVVYKLSLKPELKQMPYLQFPFGVLNLLCYKLNISIVQRSTSWITGGKRKKIINCQSRFCNYDSNLKGCELDAILIAWYELEK